MNVNFTEGLAVNGQEIDIDTLPGADIRKNFADMIVGVRTATNLTDPQKSYIVEMLYEQRDVELETATALEAR